MWVHGGYEYRELLKSVGFKFAPKKKYWCWHYGKYKRHHKGEVSLDEIRMKYGSQTVNSKSKQYALNLRRTVIIMSIRTLAAWKAYSERTGEKDISSFLNVGDLIAENLLTHIRSHMPLETDKPNYLQLKKVQGYSYNIAKALKPVFPTFVEYNNQWRYYGACFKWETINKF